MFEYVPLSINLVLGEPDNPKGNLYIGNIGALIKGLEANRIQVISLENRRLSQSPSSQLTTRSKSARKII